VKLYTEDVARYRYYRKGVSTLNIVVMEQALGPCFNTELASVVFQSRLPPIVKRPAIMLLSIWQKIVEMLAGISVSYRVRIGFCIWRFGNVFVGEECSNW
jgi:hypothetical protein